MRRRSRGLALILVLVAVGSRLHASPPLVAAPSAKDLEEAACTLSDDELLRIWRGWRADRGGDLIVVPDEPSYLGRGFPHSGPWDYVQDVPLFWYGPGFIKARGAVPKPASSADIAPTEAALLNFPFETSDGDVLRSALEPRATRKEPPKLIVTLVWDAGGRSVLDNHEKAWPYLESLIDEGTWFDNAEVGSAQSDTPPIHATIGTGSFPEHSGVLDQKMRMGREIVTPWSHGPMTLLTPTLADLYDRANDNEPIIGGLATLAAHLGALSHGSFWGGGDKDIAVNRENTGEEGAEGITWNLREPLQPYYEFPRYVNKLPTFVDWLKETDALDGSVDGAWRRHDFETDPQVRSGWDTPARIWQQTKLITTVIRRERFGKDDIPDLLFVNYKAIDNVSHAYSVDSVEMEDTVKVQDENLEALVSYLDKRVGEGQWVMVLTADHGAQRDPAVVDGYNIDNTVLEAMLNERFGESIQEVRPTQIWLNEGRLEESGASLVDISRYILELTEPEIPSKDVPATPGQKMFQAVFPATSMRTFSCMRSVLKKAGEPLRPGREEDVSA